MTSGKLWRDLLRWREYGYLCAAGSIGTSDENISELGIVHSHAYSILDVQAVEGFKLIHLRNPWAHREWQGDWSDDSPLWNMHPKVQRKLNHQVRASCRPARRHGCC